MPWSRAATAAGKRSSAVAQAPDPPFLVALNLTRRCNLRCAHCSLDAGTRRDGEAAELNTAEVRRFLDQIAALSEAT